MADEKKTYLVDIESNLDKYAKDAAEAKKQVDSLTESTKNLKKAGLDNTAEYQNQTAQLKNAKKEYSDLQKVVQAGLQLQNKELSYRQQLTAARTIEIQNIKNLGSGYIQNAQGLNVLNPKLIESRQRLADINKALIEHDLSLNSGTTNVGRYGNAVSTAFADAGKSILSMVSPLALVAGAIGIAKKVWDGMKDAIMSTTFAIDTMNKASGAAKQLFYDLAINGNINIASIKEAIQVQGKLNDLRIDEGFVQLKLSKINREEQAVRELAIDRTKTHAQRLEYLNKVVDLESQKTAVKVGHLTDELAAKLELQRIQPANEKNNLAILGIMTQINDAYAEEDAAMRRVNTMRTGFIQEEIDKREKLKEAWFKEIDETNKEEIKVEQDRKKRRHDQDVAAPREADAFIKTEIDRMDKEATDKWNKEVELQRKIFDQNRKAGKAEYDARIEQEKALAEEVIKIHEATANATMDLAGSVTDLLSGLAGENKALQNASLIADKAFAIAQIIVHTTQANNAIRTSAAMSVLPGPFYFTRLGVAMAKAMVPINLNRAAAAVEIAAIIASTITSLKGSSGGGGSSISGNEYTPSSITSTPSAQMAYATPVGSSFINQPQLAQTQLNAMPNQNLLTAKDIAYELSKLPPPVVTVEDINAKTKSVNKIAVRANI